MKTILLLLVLAGCSSTRTITKFKTDVGEVIFIHEYKDEFAALVIDGKKYVESVTIVEDEG